MSLYLYTRPLENSLFDVFDDDFFDALTPRHSFGHPCRTRHNHRNHRKNPYPSLKKQLSKLFDEDNLKLVDFSPKINLSEDEKHYYIHADLPGLNKDQVKMELNDDRILTISGERRYTYDNNNEATEKGKEEEKVKENEMETEQAEQAEKEKEEEKVKENEMETEKTEQAEKSQEETQTQEKIQKEDINKTEKNKNTRKFTVKECSYGSFSRSFSIPEDADLENVQAKMENGVLEVVFNKLEPPKPQNRTIQIQ